MASTASGPTSVGWPSRLTKARLHFVSGKGGTGKSTVAAALALALAAGGRKVLLVEVEGRQGIAQLFDVPPLPYQEVKVATAEQGGQVNALAIDTEAAFLEYIDMFYNLGLAGRAMRRIGAIEFATTIAPGLRDVLLTGKIKESVVRLDRNKKPVYDAIVVDSPPTGRIARFLDVTKAVADLAKGGPVHSQSEGVVKLLHSEQTAIHLVTLLEALPIQETVEAIDELQQLDLPIGSVIVNRNIPRSCRPTRWPRPPRATWTPTRCAELAKAAITLSDDDFAGLLTETIQHATRIRARAESAEQLDAIKVPRLELPAINDGIDLGSLYELAEALAQHRGSIAMSTTPPALDMESILRDTSNRVVVCCGAGGVGKTTTAAAMALRAAEYGRSVVVLTIDPAKRLAQALGIKDLGNTPQVPLGAEVSGELHAMMLDMRRTFDEMVVEYSGSERAQSILDNQFYQTVATSLAGTQEYMAMEKLGQLLAEDRWDLVVVDTPPSRNALDFLDAPKRLGSFMDGRLWRLLLAPGRGIGRLVTGAVGLAMKGMSTILGSQMLSDASAFVQSLDSTFGGFREKADRTYELLKRRGTQFVVVSAAEPDALREASFFVDRLSQEGMPLAGLILNRTHPTLCSLTVERATDGAEALEADDPDSLTAAMLRVHADRALTAKREVRLLGGSPAPTRRWRWWVPSLPFDVSDLEALRAIADQITH
ncbi:hypothetical protein MMUR_65890 [Mycolicibacterium murale]|uniref:ArsA/GET3 Anion-transporting ATPase-like domain-containing protein n=1 Tax=Mycolicibacterium murale TaxID=182220 RepID=A0A7I9WXK8_9MYCO|nr:hypothetical protein MMUR_65890 [Mycolicibacterium murale]